MGAVMFDRRRVFDPSREPEPGHADRSYERWFPDDPPAPGRFAEADGWAPRQGGLPLPGPAPVPSFRIPRLPLQTTAPRRFGLRPFRRRPLDRSTLRARTVQDDPTWRGLTRQNPEPQNPAPQAKPRRDSARRDKEDGDD